MDKYKTHVTSEGNLNTPTGVYWVYNVTIPVAVKWPRFESDAEDGVTIHSEGIFAAASVVDEKYPSRVFEIVGDIVDFFSDELTDAVREDLNSLGAD